MWMFPRWPRSVHSRPETLGRSLPRERSRRHLQVAALPIGYVDTRHFGPLESSWITSVAVDGAGHAHVVDRRWQLSIGIPHLWRLSEIGRIAIVNVSLGAPASDPVVTHDAQALADAAHGADVAAMWSSTSWFSKTDHVSWVDRTGHVFDASTSDKRSGAAPQIYQVRTIAKALVDAMAIDRI